MTVADLIEKLRDFPPAAIVTVPNPYGGLASDGDPVEVTQVGYGLKNTVALDTY